MGVTYLSAARKASEASDRAKLAYRDSAGDGQDSLEHLGMAVSMLADAVAELAKSMHRDS